MMFDPKRAARVGIKKLREKRDARFAIKQLRNYEIDLEEAEEEYSVNGDKNEEQSNVRKN